MPNMGSSLALVSAARHIARAPFDAVVIVGSQGALRAFQSIVEHLPVGFPAAVVFDLHRAEGCHATERLVARHTMLPVRPAAEGDALENATVYVAPSDRQLVVRDDGKLSVLDGSDAGRGVWLADAMLSSAALAYGPRLIAVVLSGRLSGGAAGIEVVNRYGGRVLVQDPATAAAPSMPNAALATGCVDFAMAPDSIGKALVAFCAATGAAELFRVRLNAGVRG
jgi:two-component system, chemotaxis family, protein-glutamate methylesterase/glutaminase